MLRSKVMMSARRQLLQLMHAGAGPLKRSSIQTRHLASTPRITAPYETKDGGTVSVDVLIIGSGPVGSTYARKLVDSGRKVVMIDAGAIHSAVPGEHLKNTVPFQRNMDLFSSLVRSHLQPISVPVDHTLRQTDDPYSWAPHPNTGYLRNGQNPNQKPELNMPTAGVVYGVGGMATHWTCSTPRQHEGIERSKLIPAYEWDGLYSEAEKLLNTRRDVFENSIRNTVVREALQTEYPELKGQAQPQNLPLAAERRQDNDEFVTWSGTDVILGDLATKTDRTGWPVSKDASSFVLLEQHRARKLVMSASGDKVDSVIVDDMLKGITYQVNAKVVVVACGTVLSAQLMYASGLGKRFWALGRYLCEQPLAFCQVIMSRKLVESAAKDPRFTSEIDAHKKANPSDPVPFPMHDPDPQCYIPVSEGRPWHCQVHRDSFSFGDLKPNIDSRLVVDLRWFGLTKPSPDNRVTFDDEIKDIMGMPQPTFEFSWGENAALDDGKMMHDMQRAARALGGYLTESPPQFMPPGQALHISGVTRMGDKFDGATSVVNTNSQVWGVDNLFVGGNGVQEVAAACNPTLTSVALAVRSARWIAASTNAQPPQ